jgi:hypothetical protein
LAELHELVHDLAFGLLTLALAVLTHWLAQPPDAARAGLAIAVLIGTSWNSRALEMTVPT